MNINELKYTKDWTNPTDFPTYEESEERVRQDQQFLFNEIKNYINGELLPALEDGALPSGGDKGQIIIKQSDNPGDAAWEDMPTRDDGYYIPRVEDGVLHWDASLEEMPEIPDAEINGPSAYEVAVKNGFEGSEEEWLESLRAERLAVTSFAVTEAEDTTTIVSGFEDGSEETVIISFGSEGQVTGINVDGVSIPVSWTEA